MFVGHYAPVFALAAARRTPGLATGFVAVQLVDVGFFSLSYLGIEKWRANPEVSGFTPVDLYYMPYTHSLAGSAAWALAAGLIVAMVTPAGRRLIDGSIVAFLVFSHWLLDLIVHRHDLPIVHDAGEKLGYGLWDQPAIAAPLEIGLLLAGFAMFMTSTQPRGTAGRIVPWLVLAILLALQAFNWLGAPPTDIATFSAMGLAGYTLCAALAWWTDTVRK